MRSTKETTHIVILGGTGDLTKRKLLHALLDLFVRKKLPEDFCITGAARRELDDEGYRVFVKEALANHEHAHDTATINAFCSHIQYLSGDSTKLSFYQELCDRTGGEGSSKLFYLAVPPALYEGFFSNIHDSGLAKQTSGENFVRILVEKPFGKDLETAQALDGRLSELFEEDQIFRIDHYLAKEAVQNILSFRFANTLLKSPWNNEHIASIHITMHETVDVDDRTGFYEDIGALRDVGQNHLLQMVALLAMEEPAAFDVEHIRKERAAVLSQLRPETESTVGEHLKRAQYTGYEEAVGAASQTETYFALTTYIDNDRWKEVPFHISAGKALPEAKVSIEIRFKDVATGPFDTESCITTENCIRLDIQPEQAMAITLNAKAPGLGFQVESRTLDFVCAKGEEEIKNSYEKVLLDCLRGDQTLFASTDEVIASWRYITSILENWQNLPLTAYEKGSFPNFNNL